MSGIVNYRPAASGEDFSATVLNVFKEWYKDGAPPDLTMQEHPSYGLLPKALWTGGFPYIYGVKTGRGAGRSKDFARAKKNDRASKLDKFQLTTNRDYARASLDNETMKRFKTDAQGFFNYMREQTDSGFQEIGDVLGHEMFRDGRGLVAKIASVAVGGGFSVFTLEDKAEIRAFDHNDVVEFFDVTSASLGTGVVRQHTDATNPTRARIVGVDHAAGTFTLTGDYSDAGGFNFTLAAGDWVAFDGDLDLNTGDNTLNINALAGLEGWNPETVTSDTWFALDRSATPNYLAGGREDFSTGVSVKEALMIWGSKAHRYKGRWDVIVLNPENFTELEKELVTISYMDIRVTPASSPVYVGYRAIELALPFGTVAVVADSDCPLNLARGVTFSALRFYTVGQVGPYLIDDDGLVMVRDADSDSFSMRIGYYGQMCCYEPSKLSRCKIPAITV